MTLYDIVLERQDTDECENGLRNMHSNRRGIKLTVRITPWLPIILPPGSTIVMNRDDGPEAMLSGPNVGLVTRGPEFYQQSRIIDGYALDCLNTDAPEYIACAGERLISDAVYKIAEFKVKEMQK